MKITDIIATNVEIPYKVEYRPAWQPGLVRKSRDFTIVSVYSDAGIIGYSGTDGYHAQTIERNVKPYLVGKEVFDTEEHARVLRNAGAMWFIDLALWDIIGKAANLPLNKLWGNYRHKVKAYAGTAELGTAQNRAELALHYKEAGFEALKIRFHHEQLKDDLALLDSVIKAVPNMKIMIDANQATNLPCPEQGVVWDYQRALTTAQELEDRGVLFGLAGAVHLCCSTPGMMWLEMMYEPPTRTIEVYQQLGGIIENTTWIDQDGYVHPSEKPGLGVEVNESMIVRYAL